MFKIITSFLSIFLMSCSLVFATMQTNPNQLEFTSHTASIQLERAHMILATLISNPEDYHLILSNQPTLGGEAVPAQVFSDKPSIIIYQGSLSPDRSNEEIAFMMAHELGHLNLHHHEKMQAQMDKIFTGHPIKISGITFAIYFQKLQEQQADLFGLDLYKKAGYDLNFFPYTLNLVKINPNIHFGSSNPFIKEVSSLSMKNSHFSIQDRFTLLTKEALILSS